MNIENVTGTSGGINDGDIADGDPVTRLACGSINSGDRIDKFICSKDPHHSRRQIQNWICEGYVRVCRWRKDGPEWLVVGQSDFRIVVGDHVEIRPPGPKRLEVRPVDIPLEIVFEDEEIIVLEKPSGLLCHPGAGEPTATLVEALLFHTGGKLSGIGAPVRSGIVHRLDRETSGLLVVAKTDRAHLALSRQFATGKVDGTLVREYLALCWGIPAPLAGTISLPIGRSRRVRTKMSVYPEFLGHSDDLPPGVRSALTRYEVEGISRLAPSHPVCQLRLVLGTGRTHQIRVHLAAIGHPVLADRKYGSSHQGRIAALGSAVDQDLTACGRRHVLHATRLDFSHPVSGKLQSFRSPWPKALEKLVDTLQIKV